ncbi:specifically androgen-regulated gene protein-like isoform X2 [Brienomyrus brachyistius]|uniref:specifically androgen-regulated gene protein-like isoform X2 n=1 Tax=Brienomyrus brachyistius TaxID=42636 RepID=UPI0020B30647|nr:specifically androgen-regulated gene protein-like isoform X2 [Brienomyrus brachyistius]
MSSELEIKDQWICGTGLPLQYNTTVVREGQTNFVRPGVQTLPVPCVMLKNEMWPSGVAEDATRLVGNTGSCDSMVGFNSTPVSVGTPISQNDNIGHLSPEEWECLMFLEKTIESLEAEENIEVSIDNADCLPFVAGSLTAKKDQVPSLMVNSKLEDVQNCPQNDPETTMTKDRKNSPSIRVATPLVLVMDGQPKVGPKLSPGKLDSCIKAAADGMNEEVSPSSHSETKAVGSPTVGTTQAAQNDPTSDFASPRGPLSYEELVQIRMSASMKSAHSRALSAEKPKRSAHPPVDIHPHNVSAHISSSVISEQPKTINESFTLKSTPPVVPPKPKLSAFSMFNKTHTPVTEDSYSDTSYLATSPSERIIMDPQRVRKEALRKLGLLKSDEANPDTLIGVAHSRRPRQSSEPGLCHHEPELPKRSPGKMQRTPNVQTTTSAPSNPSPASISEIKTATLGRFSLGPGGSSGENVAINFRNSRPRPSSLGNQKDFEDIQEVRQKPTGVKALGPSEAVRQPHSVSMVNKPYCQLGDDRQEALRKLGLLKN